MDNEQNDVRRFIFKYRSYTPIPFLVVMVIFARPSLWSMIIGAILVLLGEGLRFWGVSIAGSETRTTGGVGGTYLITNGPFAFVRNPLYVGNMMLYTGVGVMSMALFPWLQSIAVLFFYIQYLMIVTKEEEYLAERFGEDYRQYRRSVPRFLPRLVPYRAPTPPPKTVNLREGLASERRTLQAIGLVSVLVVVMYFLKDGRG